MKRFLIIIVLVICFFQLNYGYKRAKIELSGNYLLPADGSYKSIYGNSIIFPEIGLEFKIIKSVFLGVSYGYFQKSGYLSEIEEDSKSKQQLISAFIGLELNLSKSFSMSVAIGATSFNYKENAMQLEVSNTVYGYRGAIDLMYQISKLMFLSLDIKYSLANDHVNNKNIKLGGLSTGFGLGIRF